jgi:hypothetical protein
MTFGFLRLAVSMPDMLVVEAVLSGCSLQKTKLSTEALVVADGTDSVYQDGQH